MERIIVPLINLRKFYLVSTSKDASKIRARIDISDRTLRIYIKFRDFLFNGPVDVSDFDDFIVLLREKIFEKVIPKHLLEELSNNKIPFNCLTLKNILKKNGKEISVSSAKALLSLLKKLNIVFPMVIFHLISTNVELVYSFILQRGITTVNEIKSYFSDAPWVIDALLDLWSQEKIDIENLDVPKEIYKKYGRYDIPPEEVRGLKSINIYFDRRTGKKKAEIILSPKSKVIIRETL